MTPGFDVEITGTGPYAWHAYDGVRPVASGRARTKLALHWALHRQARKWKRATR